MKFQIKMILFLMLFTTTYQIDICQQLVTYEQCINTIDDQCQWIAIFNSCMRSDNYLSGCDPTLSQKLCVQQVGSIVGEEAKCVFNQFCQDIPDLDKALCSQQITQSGCLSISNPDQLCKWEEDRCQQLNSNDILNLQTNFADKQYSVSVCSNIDNYLIIHHTLLWKLLDYEPDLITIAEQKQSQIQEIKEYDSGLLQNNYIGSNGLYVWYYYKNTKTTTELNLKISDRTRQGCIAIEIQNDSEYQILFSLTGVNIGINHIYCKYISMNTLNSQFTAFYNNKCHQIQKTDLQDKSFISTNKLNCHAFDVKECQIIKDNNLKCMIIQQEREFKCEQQDLSYARNDGTTCYKLTATATYESCNQGKYCFFNTSSDQAFCDSSCGSSLTQNACILNTQCKWLGLGENMRSCVPINGCDQMGLSMDYCKNAGLACEWNSDKNMCQSVKNINILKCKDAYNIYSCSAITLQDQYCIWINNKCINVDDEPLFSHYTAFPTQYQMNRNLCMKQYPEYFQYDNINKRCVQVTQITLQCLDKTLSTYKNDLLVNDKICTNTIAQNVNKYFCLMFYNSYNRWDQYYSRCLNLSPDQYKQPCATQKIVNAKVCSVAAVDSDSYCLYNRQSFSCYVIKKSEHPLQCLDWGLNKEQCNSITTQGQYCKWQWGQCRTFTYERMFAYNCYALIDVNPMMCSYNHQISDPCRFDEEFTSCTSLYAKDTTCDVSLNPYGCQKSGAACYYDFSKNQCMDATIDILQKVQCEGAYLSESACSNVTTNGQLCIWNTNQCKMYESLSMVSCTTYPSQNQQVCTNLQTIYVNYFPDNGSCQLIDGVCKANKDQLDNCGTDLPINLHRCVNYSSGMCYFENGKCIQLQGQTEYQEYFLNQQQCVSSNLEMCGKITTPGQVCWVVNNGSTVRCNFYQSAKTDTCSTMNTTYNTSKIIDKSNNNWKQSYYNQNICSIASDECYFDPSTSKCISPNISNLYPCNTVGASYLFCVRYTYGNCIYADKSCRYMDINHISIDCQYRNKYACTLISNNCYWNTTTNLCQSSSASCPSSFGDQYLYTSCRTSQYTECLPTKGGCSQWGYYSPIPCWLPISQFQCTQYGCLWINSKCQDPLLICEDAQNLEECLAVYDKPCVYYNSKCFEAQKSSGFSCDYFDKSSYNFCQQYPDCLYSITAQNCVQYHLPSNLQTNQTPPSDVYQFECDQIYPEECLLQKTKSCSQPTPQAACDYSYEYSCPTDSYDNISFNVCKDYDSCYFSISKSQYSFCHTSTLLTCSQLSYSQCVYDLDIPCYFDFFEYSCKDATFSTCDEMDMLSVNRKACENASTITQPCIYKDSQSSCASLKLIEQTDCSLQFDEISCSFAYKLNCNLVYSSDMFMECIDGSDVFENGYSGDTLDGSTNNYYGCIALTDNSYEFNLVDFACKIINTNIGILECYYLNKNSCIKYTGMNGLHCIWNGEQCVDYKQSYSNIDCNNRNSILCLMDDQHRCKWNLDHCEELPIQNTCNVIDNNLSPGVCQGFDKCMYNNGKCYVISTYQNFYSCEQLALDKEACLNYTRNLKCQWLNNRCVYVKEHQALCDSELTQSACLSIITPQQYCQWSNNKCINVGSASNCIDFGTSKRGCLQNRSHNCYFDIGFNSCRDLSITFEKCDNNLSYMACTSVQSAICIFNQKCQPWNTVNYRCEFIINEWGCLHSEMVCVWTGSQCVDYLDGNKLCKDLPYGLNNQGCKQKSLDFCKFDENKKGCSYDISVLEYSSIDNINQGQYVQIRLNQQCNQQTNYFDCIYTRTPNQLCEWTNNRCQQSQLNRCEDQNIWGCLNNKLNKCAWRDNSCLKWIINENNYLYTTLVSKPVCQDLLLNAKYNSNSYSCVPFDFENDNCQTEGINKDTCLKISKYQCQYNTICALFNKGLQTKCEDYYNITPLVCQSITDLACKYNSNQCVGYNLLDGCLTPGLSKMACLLIVKESCYWDGQQCQQYNIKTGIQQCNGSVQSNELSCRLINYLNQACSYDTAKQNCVAHFNRYSKCSTPGLNRYACYSILRESCQYIDNQCVKYEPGNVKCFEVKSVNSLACQSITSDNCQYNSLTYSCETVLSTMPCTKQGLNEGACLMNSLCIWISDNSQCYCNTEYYQNMCDISKDSCIASELCYWAQNKCVRKRCDHLLECKGVINGESCYLNQNNQCQGAKSCYDIVFLNEKLKCDNFNFEQSSCIQQGQNCMSSTDLEQVCKNSIECTLSACKFENGICRPLECQDYNKQQCILYDGCAFINNKCVTVTSCSQINEMEICKITTINNKQCSWEEFSIQDSSKYCTNEQCQLFGAAYSVCNGNEINGKTCILDYDMKCRTCETLLDICTCNNSNNACTYMNGICKSILCVDFINSDTCNSSGRCYWSTTDQVCRKMCYQNIRQDQCEALTYECHWNKYISKCEQGIQQIPNLDLTVQIEETYTKQIIILVLAYLVFI